MITRSLSYYVVMKRGEYYGDIPRSERDATTPSPRAAVEPPSVIEHADRFPVVTPDGAVMIFHRVPGRVGTVGLSRVLSKERKQK